MDKNGLFNNDGNGIPQAWNSVFGMDMESQVGGLNCSSLQSSRCFFNRNWDNSMDQNDPFESALSSIVSSPASSHPGISISGRCGGENVVLKELIGRLGSICNSGEISPQSCIQGNNSANTSCYNTPLNSPPKLNLSMMDHHQHQIQGNLPILRNHQLPSAVLPADPGFVERAARFSCFGSNSIRVKESEFMVDSGKLSRASSNQSFKTVGSQFIGIQEEKDGIGHGIPVSDKKFSRLPMSLSPENKELDNSMEESSQTEQIPGGKTGVKAQYTNSNGRKRKAVPKGKGKETQFSTLSANENQTAGEAEKVESDAKRSRSDEEGSEKEKEKEKEKGKDGDNQTQKQTKENAKPPEPPKDYIHVRARRGQATDSHSLAERVRREKISERMKFLQDLVPGCNKVTGKAVMLDEIINYVQSLQRQVEFLSMKLATVNPRVDTNMEALLSKDTFQTPASMSNTMNHLHASAQPFYGMIPNGQENVLMAMMHRNLSMKSSHIDGFTEASKFWESDLQSVVQMGFSQNQAQSFHGTMGMGAGRMKVEL